MNTVNNGQDVIDSRDVIARIEELVDDDNRDECKDDELEALQALESEAYGCSDWEHGEALIRDSYFEEYAQDLAEDCCDIPNRNEWPVRCIDWVQAADELKMDYSQIDFDGAEYWIRS